MQQGLLGCSLLPVWLTRLASCSFPLKERYIFFNGLSSEQQACVLSLPVSCLPHFPLPASLIPPLYLMLMLAPAHSFTHSLPPSLAHSQAAASPTINSQVFFGIIRQGLCRCLRAPLCWRLVAWAQWKLWSWKKNNRKEPVRDFACLPFTANRAVYITAKHFTDNAAPPCFRFLKIFFPPSSSCQPSVSINFHTTCT